jgi:adenine-specific DNA-methyltransferase
MRYIGSKAATLLWLEGFIARMAPDAKSLCDPFAGTCTVSRHFKKLSFRIFTGDVLSLSHAMQVATIGLNRQPDFRSLAKLRFVRSRCESTTLQRVFGFLNALEPKKGYLSQHFSRASGRMFFTDANAMKIDAIRAKISDWNEHKWLSPSEQQFLLASLLVASDKVANTAGTYYAHLKQVSRKAAKEMHLVPLETFNNSHANICRTADAREVAATTTADVLYLDPPYNERDYGGYYHLPETIVRGDAPTPSGRSGAPGERPHPRSDFCKPEGAAGALADVVRGAKSRFILVHYAKKGLVPHSAIMEMLSARGRVSYRDLPVRGYSSQEHDAGRTAIHRIYWCRTAGRTS